jgi:tRNA U34 5-carboxymethylaminomethyl modifying enzyme MnmG/GidA
MSVRNPYTKMLSEVLYQQNQNSSSGTHTRSIGYRHTGCHFSVNKDSICEFIKYLIGFRMRTSDNHIRPQVEFYSEYVDYIVKQENCSKDLKNMNIDDLIVDTEFKFAEDVRSYYQNKLFNKNYDFFLNEESKELIYDAYREDFEKFGYEKDF